MLLQDEHELTYLFETFTTAFALSWKSADGAFLIEELLQSCYVIFHDGLECGDLVVLVRGACLHSLRHPLDRF